jgi:hypothetical protein
MTQVSESRAVPKRKRLKTPAAAEHLGVAPGTLVVWRSTREVVIPYYRIGRCVLYDLADLDAFLAANRVDHDAPNDADGEVQ